MVRTAQIEVYRNRERETLLLEDISKLTVAYAPAGDRPPAISEPPLTLTLIGHRSGEVNIVETGVSAIAGRHRDLLDSSVPDAVLT